LEGKADAKEPQNNVAAIAVIAVIMRDTLAAGQASFIFRALFGLVPLSSQGLANPIHAPRG
jgi:hypothetical protein